MSNIKKVVKLSVLLLMIGNVRANVSRKDRVRMEQEWKEVMIAQVVVVSYLGACIGCKLLSWVELKNVRLISLIGMFLGAIPGVLMIRLADLINLNGGGIGVSLSGALAGVLAVQDLFSYNDMFFLSYVLSVQVGIVLEMVLGCPYIVF